MKNGKHTPADSDELAKLLRLNNGLLVEQINHQITIRSLLETIMVFLPACSSYGPKDKVAASRLLRAWNQLDKRERREANKRLKKLGL